MTFVIPPPPLATPLRPSRHLADQATRAMFREAVAEIAKGVVGYVETPVNNTPFGSWIGLNRLPWCISAVSYIYACAAREIDCENPLAGIQTKKGPAGATELWRIGKAKKWALGPAEAPMLGDVLLWDHDDADGGPGHGGLVIALDGATVVTGEGNTTRSASATRAQARNGGEYASHRHAPHGGGRPDHGRFLGYLRLTRRYGR